MQPIKHVYQAFIRALKDNNYRKKLLIATGIFNNLSDRKFIELVYSARTGMKLNLDSPSGFNEKLQWLKLYDHNDLYTLMSDKYLVKQYVAERIGKEHIVPTLGVWDDPDEIDFEALPERFVLKCNHNSGLGMCICKDKALLDIRKTKESLRIGLAENYYLNNREWNYKNIRRRIIAEKYMEDPYAKTFYKQSDSDGLVDYKFYCFDGIPKFLYIGYANMVSGIKHDMLTFMTLDWEIAPFYRDDHEQIFCIPPKPTCFEELMNYSSILSRNIPFVRVDFFVIDNKPYFSEFTFIPGSGYGIFKPEIWERTLGEWISLPKDRHNIKKAES